MFHMRRGLSLSFPSAVQLGCVGGKAQTKSSAFRGLKYLPSVCLGVKLLSPNDPWQQQGFSAKSVIIKSPLLFYPSHG